MHRMLQQDQPLQIDLDHLPPGTIDESFTKEDLIEAILELSRVGVSTARVYAAGTGLAFVASAKADKGTLTLMGMLTLVKLTQVLVDADTRFGVCDHSSVRVKATNGVLRVVITRPHLGVEHSSLN